MGKFNFKNYYGSTLQQENSLVKIAAVEDYFIRTLEVPGTGKTFKELFQEKIPNETEEQKNLRMDDLKARVSAIKNDKIFIRALTVAEQELKGQSGTTFRHIIDINNKLFSIAMEKYFPIFEEGAMKMKFDNNWSPQNQSAAISEWKNGLTNGMRGGGFVGRGDFIYLIIRSMIGAIKGKEQWYIRDIRKFDRDRVELFFHECENDTSKLNRFSNYEQSGAQAVEGVVHSEDNQSESGSVCGFIKASSPGWFYLNGKKSSGWCNEKFTKENGPFQGSENQSSKNHALLFAASQSTGWCTGGGSAEHYLSLSNKFYLYFPQGNPIDQSGRVNQASVAIVGLPDGTYQECVGHQNSAPWGYLSQIMDVMNKEKIKPNYQSKFGYSNGVTGDAPFKWYTDNKDKSPAEIFPKVDFILEGIKSSINSFDNIVDLASSVTSGNFKEDLIRGARGIDATATMGIIPEIMKKPGAKEEYASRVNSYLSKENLDQKMQGLFKDILNIIFPNLGSMSAAKDKMTQNFRSLITQKVLPPEEEELLFRDDKESTLREIVDHFIYK
jgi:hypothetical protein